MPAIEVISALAEDERDFEVTGAARMAALFRAEERHFWHRSRNRVIVERLRDRGVRPGARVLELGCGGGCVAGALFRAGYAVTGVDGHRSLLETAHAREPGLRLWQHDLRRGTGELPERGFDAVGLFDVIEHLDDPRAALEAAVTCATPGGLVVGTVPALMALWSTIDQFSGHKLRYDARSLATLLATVRGARVIEVAPFFRALVPLLWAQRRLVGRGRREADAVANLSVPPRPVNGALSALVVAEHRARPWLDRTAIPGASLWFALERDA